MFAIIFGALTFVSTLADGLFAVRYRKRFGILAAFAAGVLIAVSLFDLFPEAFRLAATAGVPLERVMYVTAVGFIFLLILERYFSVHRVCLPDGTCTNVHHHKGGFFGAAELSAHSFMDGLAIGIGFHLEFDYGRSVIKADDQKKIGLLEKSLQDRPSIKLEVEGHVDMERDREALRQPLYNKKLKAQKLNKMIKKGMAAIPIDEVKIEPQEYENYLKMAYKVETFPKPRNFLGFSKSIPVPEMEKLMLTHIVITDGDLRSLASQRAMNVKDLIVKSDQIESERIFIIEPKSLTPEKKEKLKDSRVGFRLK